MKNVKSILLIALVSIFVGTSAFKPMAKLIKIGAKAPLTELKMMDISGESYSLSDLTKENGLLVIFSCNTCPFVLAWEDRYAEIASMCEKENIGMVAVNSNEAKRQGESMDDSMDAMKIHAEEKGYKFKYILDIESELAKAFGATKTPQIFLFDKGLSLKYTGAIDDNLKDASKVENHYLLQALGNLVNNKEIDPDTTPALGCSIKRVAVKK
ncbi:MAG: thioredoxin family protein [Flavobacteriales bacterium]|nr:thioredoxin family protein [Flavobacteriales bacterium]